MQNALNNFEISGIKNNLNLLASIVKSKKFLDGDINTGFIAEEYPNGFSSEIKSREDSLMFSLVAIFADIKNNNSNNNNNLKLNERSLVASVGNNIFEFKVYNAIKNTIIEHDGRVISLESDWNPGDRSIKIKIDEDIVTLQIQSGVKGYKVSGFGLSGTVKIRSEIAQELSAYMIKKVVTKNTKIIKCPMPGLVISIDIEQGQIIEDGDKLCTIEAMKMENIIRSEVAGVIKKIHCKEGESLSTDQIMIEFE